MGFYQWLHLPIAARTTLAQLRSGYVPPSTPSSTVLTPLSQLSSRAAGRQITPLVISSYVLNIPPNSPHWIYGNDLEKLLNF